MSNIVSDLLTVTDTNDTPAELLAAAERLGTEGLRVVAMTVLAWLQRQKKYRHERPLELNPSHTWCGDLRGLIALCPAFGDLFEVEGNRCAFRATVSQTERAQIRDLAEEGYRPIPKP